MSRKKLFSILLFMPFVASAQINGLNYQGIFRDINGIEIQNAAIDVRVGVISTSPGGTLEWEEVHSTSTNEFGLFNLVIGEGMNTGNGAQPDFGSIGWGSAEHFLKVETDDGGGYEDMGTSKFNYVPYALFALNAEQDGDWEIIPGTIFNNQDDIGVGTNTTEAHLHVKGEGGSSNEVFKVEDSSGNDAIVVNSSSQVAIGGGQPTSSLHINGSQAGSIDVLIGPATLALDQSHYLLIGRISNGDITLNLPPASSCMGRYYNIKAYSDNFINTLFIVPQPGDLIDLVTGSISLGTQFSYDQVVVVSDGDNWWIVSE